MPRHWVGIDSGSTATKACLIDRRGRVRRQVRLPVPIRYPRSGWAETDGEAIYRSAREALRRLLRGIDPGEIAAVGLAAQRSTFLFWDGRSGRPLTPAISWQDRRSEEICSKLASERARIRRKTGLRLSPHYAAGKIRWLLDRSPSLRRMAERGLARLGTLDSYLLFRITRGDSWSTDPTHAARTLLMNLRNLEWDPELLDLFHVPLRALPPIRPSLFPAGEIGRGAARIRIAATLGDQQAALIGLGCRREGEAAINYGTGAFVVLNTGRRPVRSPGLLTSIAWSSPSEVRYILEGTINSAGGTIDWMRKSLARSDRSDARFPELDRVPVVIPSFAGLAAPHWRSDVQGAVFDLDLGTRPSDLRTATLAGIAGRVREIVEAMEGNGRRIRRIIVGGGLTRDPLLARIQAALLGRPIRLSGDAEGTARGAALLAGGFAAEERLLPGSGAQPDHPLVPSRRDRREGDRWYRRFLSARKALMARSGGGAPESL